MKTRLPTLAAAVSIAVFLGWMATRLPSEPPPRPGALALSRTETSLHERSGGSDVPCAVPLAWRIARVDPRFGVSAPEAEAVVQDAARLWEEATGRRLFARDPEGGFPIRLVYDERQELLLEREDRERAIDSLRWRLGAERDALMARSGVHATAAAAHVDRATDLERRVAEHNATVRRWNELGNVPESRGVALASAGDALQREQDVLAAERSALEAQQASLSETEARLNQRLHEHQLSTEELAAAFPPSSVEAGEYRELVTRVDGRLESVSREIRLYRFASGADLRLLVAHELGHALGLGHTEDPSGVMHASAVADQPVARLAATDVALFTSVCPAR